MVRPPSAAEDPAARSTGVPASTTAAAPKTASITKVFHQGLATTATQSAYVENPDPARVPGLLFNETMQFTRKGLKAEGFAGFRPIQDLETMRIPQGTGLFAVIAPNDFQPCFCTKSTAGVFKKKDPSLPSAVLAAEWVDGAVVLYLGKAGPGSKGNRGLRRQVQEFLDFGQGKPPGHWDGRPIWQLANSGSLAIAWKELRAEQLNDAAAGYHAAFVEQFGRLPFANLVQARTKAGS